MAWPPRQSWTSFSRRERNRALFSVVGSGLAVAVGLVILLTSRADPAQGRAMRETAMDGVAPLWSWAQAPLNWIDAQLQSASDYFAAVDKLRLLRAQRARDDDLRMKRDALARENRQLKALLRVIEPTRGEARAVAISGASSGSYVRSAVISGGRVQGLRVGQPVRSPDGLVGRIVETGNHASRVLLLNDVSSLVPVRVVRTGKPAMVAGINGPLLEVRYVAPADGPLRRGDRLVTSGDGGIFPPDIPVARVTGFRGELPVARPSVRLDGLGYVLVERPWLPPLPAPAATSTTAGNKP